jgi:hypothetical protein
MTLSLYLAKCGAEDNNVGDLPSWGASSGTKFNSALKKKIVVANLDVPPFSSGVEIIVESNKPPVLPTDIFLNGIPK